MSTEDRVAFVGLGVMGFPMAGHIRAAGFDVAVFNRTASRAEEWQQRFGGRVASSPAAVAQLLRASPLTWATSAAGQGAAAAPWAALLFGLLLQLTSLRRRAGGEPAP